MLFETSNKTKQRKHLPTLVHALKGSERFISRVEKKVSSFLFCCLFHFLGCSVFLFISLLLLSLLSLGLGLFLLLLLSRLGLLLLLLSLGCGVTKALEVHHALETELVKDPGKELLKL